MDDELRELDRRLLADPDDPIARQRLIEARRRSRESPPDCIGDFIILQPHPHPALEAYEVRAKDQEELLVLELYPTPTHEFCRAFAERLSVLTALQHPGLVAIHSFGAAERGFFVVTTPTPRTSLAELYDQGPLPPARALPIFEGLARILEIGHRAGLRCGQDFSVLEAYKVFLDAEDRPRTCGLITPPPTPPSPYPQIGLRMPAPHLMSPEQLMGRSTDPRSDVYTLGALLYQALTGRPTFSGSSIIQVIRAALQSEAPAPSSLDPDLPPDLDHLIARAMAKRTEDRHPSAEAFADALRDLQEGRPIPPYTPPAPPPPRRSWWSRLWRR